MERSSPLHLLGYSFEAICQDILLFHGFSIQPNFRFSDKEEIDIKFSNNEIQGIAEIKLYRSRVVSSKMIENAVQRLEQVGSSNLGVKLLILSTSITVPYKSLVRDQYGVNIWDIHDLFHLAFNNPNLYYRLEQIYVMATGETAGNLSIVNEKEIPNIIRNLKSGSRKSDFPHPKYETIQGGTRGEFLCNALKKIDPGREKDKEGGERGDSNDKVYEKTCIEILKYLFDRDLTLWDDQLTTDHGIHRFDLICRIRSDHSFWKELSNDFNSRYVIFEFKNYNKKIKQGQVYTTEKYLFNRGYRTVAFIVSKKGPDKNAMIATKGALREQGKLIVHLTDEDLCKMMTLFEGRGEISKVGDPTEVLMEKIDELLTKVVR